MICLVVCLLVPGSENETTDEQPTENRHLGMNRDDYAKLQAILDFSSNVYRGLYGLDLLPNTNQLSEECLRLVTKHACTQLHKFLYEAGMAPHYFHLPNATLTASLLISLSCVRELPSKAISSRPSSSGNTGLGKHSPPRSRPMRSWFICYDFPW